LDGMEIQTLLSPSPAEMVLAGQSSIEKERIKGEMLKGHFTIGDHYNRSLKDAGTMWKPATIADL
jgi:hypothetical protein